MPLLVGFVELLGAVLLLTAAITGASFADVITGRAGQLTKDGSPSPSSSFTTSTASTPAGGVSGAVTAPGSASAGVTPTSFAKALLQSLGAPLTAANVSSIVAWEAREGGNWHNTARYNPLNTTQAEPGSRVTGSQGDIAAYSSWQQGLEATVQTLQNGDYNDILSALKSGAGLAGGRFQGLLTWSDDGYGSV